LLYSGPVYNKAYGITGTYTRAPECPLTASQAEFNKTMSKVLITVEHLFGRILNLWATNRYKYRQKISSFLVAAIYLIAVFLMNIQTCLNTGGNQVTAYFNCMPPTLHEYLGGVSRHDEVEGPVENIIAEV